ncbi:MAG: tetratricopeptide repeat protein [Treponema sp.]|nr:tetratricopeptide repeat protein [Treponema sp.]
MEKGLLLSRAQAAVISRDFALAVKLYKTLLKDEPDNLVYLKELGNIHVKNGEDEKAIPYFEQIITFHSQDVDAMISLGAIYRRLQRYEDSIIILNRALDEGENGAMLNYTLGFTYKEMKQYDDAIDCFEIAISENPTDVLAYNHLGSIYLERKEYQKSINSFKRGLQIDQNHPIINYNLARCYEEANLYSDAIRCFEIALKTKPGWIDAIRDFSELLVKCQRSKEASDLVTHAIDLHPNDSKLLSLLGKIYLDQYDYLSAEDAFKKAYSNNNNDIQILSGLAEALEKGEKIQESLEAVISALEIEPENKDVRKQYVHVLLSAREYDKAHESLKELYKETGDEDVQVLDLCEQYYICVDEDERSQQIHERINKVDKKYNKHMLNAAERFIQKGKDQQAEEMAKNFIEKEAQNPDGYNTLAKVYISQNKLPEAIETYNKSQSLKKPNVLASKQVQNLQKRLNIALQNQIPQDEVVVPQEEIKEEELNSELLSDENEVFDFEKMGDNIPFKEELIEEEDDFFAPDLKDVADEEIDVFENKEEEPLSTEQELLSAADEKPESLEGYVPAIAESDENDDFDFDVMGDNPACEEEITENSNEDEDDLASLLDQNEFVPQTEPVSVPNQTMSSQNQASIDDKLQLAEQKLQEAENLQLSALDTANKVMESVIDAQKVAQKIAEEQQNLIEEQKNQLNEQIELSKNQEEQEEESLNDILENDDIFEEEDKEEIIDDKNETEISEEEVVSEQLPNDENSPENLVQTVQYLLPKIERILEDDELALQYTSELELFKKLLDLCEFLPEDIKKEFLTSKVRLQIEYVIAKMSGKPGLLKTAHSLLKSGVISDSYVATTSEEEMNVTNEVLFNLIDYTKKLSEDLEDKSLAEGLQTYADSVLEQIELQNLSAQIFE